MSCALKGVARVVENSYDAVNARYMLLAGDNRVRAISSQEGAVRVSRCKPDVYYKSRYVYAHDNSVRCTRTASFHVTRPAARLAPRLLPRRLLQLGSRRAERREEVV